MQRSTYGSALIRAFSIGLATPLADPVGAVVDALERTFDLVEEIADVLLDRQVLLAFERGRSGVGGLVVQADVTGHLGLGGGEGVLFEGGELGLQLAPLLDEAGLEIGRSPSSSTWSRPWSAKGSRWGSQKRITAGQRACSAAQRTIPSLGSRIGRCSMPVTGSDGNAVVGTVAPQSEPGTVGARWPAPRDHPPRAPARNGRRRPARRSRRRRVPPVIAEDRAGGPRAVTGRETGGKRGGTAGPTPRPGIGWDGAFSMPGRG